MIILICLFLLPSIPAQAEIFFWVDIEGKKHFSDKAAYPYVHIFPLNQRYNYYTVKKVYDGDTVLLANGKKIRLLGINTPEVERRNQSVQTGGEEAKIWLINELKHKKVRMESDVKKKDKYGRFLAHLFTKGQTHLNLELVKRGLASVNIHPPNLKYTDTLLTAQKRAKKAKKGIWKDKAYAPKPANQIKKGTYKGWQRVVGYITNIRHGYKYNYLTVTDTFSIKISKKSLSLFPKLAGYVGKQVEVRGWINRYKKKYSMFVRHPSSIIFL